MKKLLTNWFCIALALIALCALPATPAFANENGEQSFADVGNQNDYGDDGNDDSYDYDWDYDDDDDYSWSSSSSSSSSSSGSGGILADICIGVVFLFIGSIYLLVNMSKQEKIEFEVAQKKAAAKESSAKRNAEQASRTFLEAGDNEARVIQRIKERDPFFSEQEFEGWAKEVFMTVNEAWTARDVDRIRPIESTALFNEHRRLLEQYISKRQINKIDRLGILSAYTSGFEVDAHFEYVTVMLKAQMIDYVVDEVTDELIVGDRKKVIRMLYTIVFSRAAGTLSSENPSDIRTTDCPSCGAPIQITAGGRCEWCRSILETNKHGWVMCSYTGTRVRS